MNEERRRFLKLMAITPLVLLGCSPPTRRELLLESKKPGEWISHELYEIVITDGNDSEVKVVNIRSHWDTSEDHKYKNERIVGTVKVGAPSFRSTGQIRGVVGWGADPAFFVIEKEELIRLNNAGFIEMNPQYTKALEVDLYYYINADYVKIGQQVSSR